MRTGKWASGSRNRLREARYFKPGKARDTLPLGSPGFAAPEQYGQAQTSPRADIYSLGAVVCIICSRAVILVKRLSFSPNCQAIWPR